MKQILQLLSDWFTILEQSIDDFWANPERPVDELDESSCWACKEVPQSCSIHFELSSNLRWACKTGLASRNDDFLGITPNKSSISPFFVLFPVLWMVATVLSESAWSLDGVGVGWSGSGTIIMLWLIIGPTFRWVVFHSLTCLYNMSLCCLNLNVMYVAISQRIYQSPTG